MRKIASVEKTIDRFLRTKPIFAEKLDRLYPELRQTPEMREADQKEMDLCIETMLCEFQTELNDLLEEKIQFELANPLGPKSATKLF